MKQKDWKLRQKLLQLAIQNKILKILLKIIIKNEIFEKKMIFLIFITKCFLKRKKHMFSRKNYKFIFKKQ